MTSWRSLLTLQRTGSRPRVKAWPGGGQAEGTWVASSGQVLLEEARDSVPSNHLYQQLGEDLEAEIRSHTGSACPLYSQALTTSEAVHLTPPRFSSSPQSALLKHSPRHSPSYLVGVICLGVDKHPPTRFLATPVSTHRCLRKGTIQASPSAFMLRLTHPNFGLRRP